MPRHFIRYSIGEKIGKWTVIAVITEPRKRTKYRCQCICGTERKIRQTDLQSGRANSCMSCTKRSVAYSVGDKIENWTVVEVVKNPREQTAYLCRCKCGRELKVLQYSLKNGISKSCKSCAKRSPTYGVGEKIGKWTVLDVITKLGEPTAYLCRCECGRERKVRQVNLRSSQSKSCGSCAKRSPIYSIGDTIGRWTVIKIIEKVGAPTAYLCRCECGREKEVVQYSLKNGTSRSCGCSRRHCDITFAELRDEIEKVGERTAYLCRCECGRLKEVAQYSLKKGKSHSCGCGRRVG